MGLSKREYQCWEYMVKKTQSISWCPRNRDQLKEGPKVIHTILGYDTSDFHFLEGPQLTNNSFPLWFHWWNHPLMISECSWSKCHTSKHCYAEGQVFLWYMSFGIWNPNSTVCPAQNVFLTSSHCNSYPLHMLAYANTGNRDVYIILAVFNITFHREIPRIPQFSLQQHS